jgi:hypothetical protein
MLLVQAYLVGDPVQLPATVISSMAVDHGYNRSMFERLASAGYPVRMLNVQYRMHPDVSAFPSQQFYAGSLRDGESVAVRTPHLVIIASGSTHHSSWDMLGSYQPKCVTGVVSKASPAACHSLTDSRRKAEYHLPKPLTLQCTGLTGVLNMSPASNQAGNQIFVCFCEEKMRLLLSTKLLHD